MRHAKALLVGSLLGSLLLVAGCGGDCLPAPTADATPPDVRLTVVYIDAATGQPATRSVGVRDATVTVTVDADAGEVVEVVYTASDSSGLRGVQLGATYQLTVGMGVHHESVRVPAVAASCPRAVLTGEASFPGGGRRRDLILSAAAQNWMGRRIATSNLVVRFVPGRQP